MTTELAMTSARKKIGWAKPVLIAGGMVWLIRAGLALVFQPDYWDPQTLLDYVAVAGTSLGLLLLALGVWGIHLGRHGQGGLSKLTWSLGIGITCLAAVMVGGANFVEDWFGLKAFGDVFVFGMMFLLVGMILAGQSSLRATDISRWTGWLLLACAVGFGTLDWGGEFVVGTSLVLLGVLRD